MAQPLAAAAVLTLTLALLPPTCRLLRRLDLLDRPTERSSHELPTLRGGGLAPAVVMLGVVAVAPGVVPSAQTRMALLVAGAGFAVIGLAADLGSFPPLPRLLCQVLVALLAIGWLTAAAGPSALLVSGLVILWLVSYVNAFNFMDGINGIAAAQAIVAGGAFAAVGAARGEAALAGGGLLVAAAAVGFLPFNFPHARVFLGDVGSYFFGAWLAVLVVAALRAGLTPEAAVAPVAVWLADTATTLVGRARRREVLYRAHRHHVYQRLTQLGWTHTRVTLAVGAVVAATASLGASTLIAPLALRVAADALLLALLFAYLAAPRLVAAGRPTEPSLNPQ